MESRGSSNITMQTCPKRSGIVINEGGDTNPQCQTFKRASDQYMPMAQVVSIMRRALPPHAKIADDAKETIQECVSEFINFVTTPANERCHKECRKTISPNDVISAMGSLGFEKYVEPLSVFLDTHHAQDPERRATQRRYTPYARQGVHGPLAQVAQPPPGLAQAGMMAQHDIHVALPPQMDGYFMAGQDSGEGFSGGADSDPFAELLK